MAKCQVYNWINLKLFKRTNNSAIQVEGLNETLYFNELYQLPFQVTIKKMTSVIIETRNECGKGLNQ